VAVFADDRALLVDATYRWFGVPHKEYVILDDLQAIAHHLVQQEYPGREVAQRRLAVKLHPNFAWTQFALIRSLCKAEQWDEARRIFESVQELESDRSEICLWRGIFADHDGDLDAAADYLRRASALDPENAVAHLGLAEVLRRQGKLKEAREEFRACLRYAQDTSTADTARKMIAQINEQIGIEGDLPRTDGLTTRPLDDSIK
jgi:pentatricopeptide repeat protein